MVGIGVRPYRGTWSIRQFDTTSTATFRQFCPVSMSSTHLLQEFGTAALNEKIVGIALHASVDSFPAGKVAVAIPGFGATALTNVQTGASASYFSRGLAYDVEKSGNNLQLNVDSTTSACVVVMGELNSANSTIEVAFTDNSLLVPVLARVAQF